MNTIQLECFLAVAEHLNFSKASEALKITQAAVSHQIRSLESELDVKLFIRTSKNVCLTSEGLQFLPDAELILKTALSARERLGKHDRFISFDVGCRSYPDLGFIPDVFRNLAAEFPLLRPSVHIVPFPSLFGLIEDRQLHAALGIKESPNRSALTFREIFTAPVACVCAPGHPLAGFRSLTKNELSGSIIACSPRHIPNAVLSVQSRFLSGLESDQRYFAENIESAFILVKSGFGYTLYPDIPSARDPGLHYIPVTDLPSIPFGIYYRTDNDHPVMKRFLNLCEERITKPHT